MTELASAASMNQNSFRKDQSIGLPLPMVNMKVIDIEDGRELSYDEEGELLVCSPGLMVGYFENEAATQEAIDVIDGRRWLHTGDVGKIDRDGYAYITGRLKRIYITRDSEGMAYKLFPQHLEEVVEKIVGVDRCAVVVLPDDSRLNIPVVYVQAYNTTISNETICEYIKKELPEYYTPKYIEILDMIPTNQNQKIDYKELEKKANNSVTSH